LEEINGDLVETDFWPNVISGSPANFPELRSPTFRSQRSVSDSAIYHASRTSRAAGRRIIRIQLQE
jgi:hypothetical protein